MPLLNPQTPGEEGSRDVPFRALKRKVARVRSTRDKGDLARAG